LFGEHIFKGRDVQVRTAEASVTVASQDDTQQSQNNQTTTPGNSPAMVGAGVIAMPWHSRR
jgi:hypothetical protein